MAGVGGKLRFRRGSKRLSPPALDIVDAVASDPTDVDRYWGSHTVNSKPFRSERDSREYLEWRFEEYPFFREYMDLWGNHDGQTVLDYGCGPGNDVVGFLLNSSATVVGMDVSDKALDLARQRVELHGVPLERVRLIRIGDGRADLPLESGSVDFINCGGVLHHTSEPEAILKQFRRVLGASGEARIMVYNRSSLWFHLYTAYVAKVLEGRYEGLDADEAFSRNTDGEDCPISRAYEPEDFVDLARTSGFDATFIGGYFGRVELAVFAEHGRAAVDDPRLPEEHRAFLRRLEVDANGFPVLQGKHVGVGGSYLLRPSSVQ